MTVKNTIASLSQKCRLFAQSTGGATAIEYGLIASLIAVFIIGAVQVVGTELSTTFENISDSLSAAREAGTPG